MTKEEQSLINLSVCALTGKKPEMLDEQVNIKKLFQLADRQNLVGVLFYAIKQIEDTFPKKAYIYWWQLFTKSVNRDSVRTQEYEKIKKALSEQQIDFLPIKGITIRNLYPNPDMRSMGDIDIVVRKKDFAKASKCIKSAGFEKIKDGAIHHIFKKNNVFLELHRDMVLDYSEQFDYYSDPFSIAEQTSDNKCMYRLSDNDSFVYSVAHYEKHYGYTGCGIRFLFDFYIMQKKLNLDMNYIKKQIDILNISDVFNSAMSLVEVWFYGKDKSEDNEKLESYLLEAGIFGDTEKTIETEVKIIKGNGSKFKYFIRRIFPPLRVMRYNYLSLEKYPFLLPACWIKRFCTKVIPNIKRLKKEVNIINKK